MSGIGWTEFLVIALILLIFVGPQRLPELFGKMAWMISQLRAASRDLRNQLDVELSDLRQAKSDFTAEMKAQTDRLYAEARLLDDEFSAVKDKVKDMEGEVKGELSTVKGELEGAGNSGESGGTDEPAKSVRKESEGTL